MLSTEILCLIIALFLVVMFNSRIKPDKNVDLHKEYYRLLLISLFHLLTEVYAAVGLHMRDTLSSMHVIIMMYIFYISFLSVLFLSFLFIKKLIETDLPSNKKVNNYLYVLTGMVLAVTTIIPAFCVRVLDDNRITFISAVYVVFALLGFFVLSIVAMCIIYIKHINAKRRKILLLSGIFQLICLILQLTNPHILITSIETIMLLLPLYMTLDNEDVKMVEQLRREKERADKANRAKSGFIANVSHEIRTPINAILGMDEMILRETNEDGIKQYAFDIKSAATTLHGIINEILDMSKMESGKMEILPVNFNMRSLINDTVNMIQIKAETKNLEFSVEADAGMPSGFYGDETRIKQILTNLLSNSVKYTQKGSIKLSINGEASGERLFKVTFTVEDTGIGMKEEDLEKLTQEYTRFDSEKNRNVEGTGLGMNITLKLVEMMNSKLYIDSEYGKGTKASFELELPIWDDEPLKDFKNKNIIPAESYEYKQSFEAPSNKVLVVDDNAINRKVFRGLLRATKLNIDEAESGAVCLNLVRQNKYDIIFMDHMMPEMDGIETFHKLQELEDNLSKNAPVIMLTANAVSGAKENYLKEGFADFIAKPIVPTILEEKIRKLLPSVEE